MGYQFLQWDQRVLTQMKRFVSLFEDSWYELVNIGNLANFRPQHENSIIKEDIKIPFLMKTLHFLNQKNLVPKQQPLTPFYFNLDLCLYQATQLGRMIQCDSDA